MILELTNLDIYFQNNIILNSINLNINKNEIHYILGPNGSGKSTLLKTIAGHPAYNISRGSILYNNENISKLTASERASKGIFLLFQQPIEISNITNYDFLYLIYTEKQKYNNTKLLTKIEFYNYIKKILIRLKFNDNFLFRKLNYNFSGGEKKKNEILQLLLLKPNLILIDEFDSGLDIEALKLVSKILRNEFRFKSSFLIITHNLNILKYFLLTKIHIIKSGFLIKSGKKKLVDKIKKYGY